MVPCQQLDPGEPSVGSWELLAAPLRPLDVVTRDSRDG